MHSISSVFRLLLSAGLLASGLPSSAQQPFHLVEQNLPNPENEPANVFPLPTERQLEWQGIGFYAFFHYGMNTYTDKEWGYGNESESSFAPTAVPRPYQWLKAAKKAGMKGGIAVVKHHDGFCLWPAKATTHSVERCTSPNGRATNIPRDFAAAAKKLGMLYGFYVSPWDRNSAYYADGTDRYLRRVYLAQFTELAQYGGPGFFDVWLDGANGGNGYYGGADTTRSIEALTYYDVPNLRDSLKQLFPQALIWGLGGEARWIGNEKGFATETNWCMMNEIDGGTGKPGIEQGWHWQPAESDAMITDKGWFWHSGEKVLSGERLFRMYLETIGRNANFILNCPPARDGLLPKATVDSLARLGQLVKKRLSKNLARKAVITASVTRSPGATKTYGAENLNNSSADDYWAAPDGVTSATLTAEWKKPQKIRYLKLGEYVRKGQRVRSFTVETSLDGVNWHKACGDIKTTTIGFRRILPLNGSTENSYSNAVEAKYLRVSINDSRACPLISVFQVF